MNFKWRMVVDIFFNLLFLQFATHSSAATFVSIGFAVAAYGALYPLRRWKNRILPATIVLTLLIFCYLKGYWFMSVFSRTTLPMGYVGLSYILFRLVALYTDVAQNSRPVPGFLGYLNYLFSYLTLISGPIQSYESFDSQIRSPVELNTQNCWQSLSRIATGYLKVAVLSLAFNIVFSEVSSFIITNWHSLSPETMGLEMGISAVSYCLFLYINFSGYMDIVLGIGTLAGFNLPENFNSPFQSNNFLEFWERWHITMSEWFRDYLFSPIAKAITRAAPQANFRPYIAVITFFITFLIIGIWHGPTPIFVVYGLLLGTGVSFNKLYQIILRSYLGKARQQEISKKWIYKMASRGLALAFFALALTCLWFDLQKIQTILYSFKFVGRPIVLSTTIIGMLMVSMVEYLILATSRKFNGFIASQPGFVQGLIQPIVIGLKITPVICAVLSLSGDIPEFVYKMF